MYTVHLRAEKAENPMILCWYNGKPNRKRGGDGKISKGGGLCRRRNLKGGGL